MLFRSSEYQAADLIHEVDRALRVFADPPSWKTLVANGMSADFSWKRPAREYLELYQLIQERRKK